MILYKYLPPSRLDVLLGSKIRFTQLGDLNDPFENQPHIDELALREAFDAFVDHNLDRMLREELDNTIGGQQLISNQCFLKLAITRGSYAGSILSVIEREFPNLLKDMLIHAENQALGALSLSEVNTHPLMWGHYADGHRGYVLGFDSESPSFCQEQKEGKSRRHLQRVVYTDSPPKIRFEDIQGTELFFTKGSAWKYEAEWRMLLPLSESDETIPSSPFPIHLFRFPPESVSEIILGARMTNENRAKIEAFVSSRKEYSHVSICQAVAETKESVYGISVQQLRGPA